MAGGKPVSPNPRVKMDDMMCNINVGFDKHPPMVTATFTSCIFPLH